MWGGGGGGGGGRRARSVAKRRTRSVAERRTRGGEMLPTLAIGWRASALRGEEAGRFREVAGVSIFAAGFNSRQPSGLNKLNLNISTSG